MDLYDITNIPYFAYSPDFYTWVIFVALGLLLLGVVYLYGRRQKTTSNNRAFDETLSQLDKLLAAFGEGKVPNETSLLKDYLARAGISCKRLLSRFENSDIYSACTTELKKFQMQSNSVNVQNLTAYLIKIQDISYRPEVDQETTENTLTELRNVVKNYRNEKLVEKK